MLAYDQITAAAGRLQGRSTITPLIQSPALNQHTKARLYLKLESLQRGGSFKYRGAFNTLSQLTARQQKSGVVAWSSGNHAQGVATAARELGIPATIVMPDDAPRLKIDNTRALDAQVVLYNRNREQRERIGRKLADKSGATVVAPYDNYQVMAGQGTVGLEMVNQLQAQNRASAFDSVLVCCGGGGLTAGIATALHTLSPHTRIYAVEPAHFDDHHRSLAAGCRVQNKGHHHSICDALLAPTPGELTFPINQRLLAGVLVVSDDQVRAAIGYAFTVLKLVVEPGGAVALAAALNYPEVVQGRNVGVVVSGGNIDPGLFTDIIRGDTPELSAGAFRRG